MKLAALSGLPILGVVMGFVACSSSDSRSSSSGGHVRVQMKSTSLSSRMIRLAVPLLQVEEGIERATCNLSLSGSNVSGNCYTPLNITGRAASISLTNQFGMGAGGSHRLIDFGGGSELSTGKTGAVALGTFDFATPATNTSDESEDTIQSTTYFYDRVQMLLGTLDMKVMIPQAIANKYWTVRYVLLPHPILSNTTINGCFTGAEAKATVEANSKIFTSPTADITAGDILVCQKPAVTDTCADADFKWIRASDADLSSTTRPTSPVRLAGTFALETISCTAGAERPSDMSLGGMFIEANITAPFSLKKEEVRANNEGGSPDAAPPASTYNYTYTSGCTATSATAGTCTGTPETKKKMLVTVNYTSTDSIFVPSDIDLTTASETVLLQNLHRILPAPMYVKNNQTAAGNGNNPGMAAAVTITLSDTF